MKNIFLSLTTLFAMAACVDGPTAVQNIDELDSIENMLNMVDDDAGPISTVTIYYAGDSTRTRRSVNTRGKPSFRVVIHRLHRNVHSNPLSDERMHRRVLAGLEVAKANLAKLWAMRAAEKECRAVSREEGVVRQCSLKRKMMPIVRDTRKLLHRIIMAVRSDRRNRRGR